MIVPNYDAAVDWAIGMLEVELPQWLKYHDTYHTRHDVIPAVSRLAALSGLTSHSSQLLIVAAAFHDIGHVVSYDDHEAYSIQLTREHLPRFGFSPLAVDQVCGAIAATRIPQSPQTLFEKLLADADLDVLGRQDYLVRREALYQELTEIDAAPPLPLWNEEQLNFISEHQYFSPAARSLRANGKRLNIVVAQQMASNQRGREV